MMSDDKSKRGEPDRSRINPNEDYEVDYWCGKFGVTPQQLKEAVKTAGNSPDAVKAALKR
jgi:hypothetical protein